MCGISFSEAIQGRGEAEKEKTAELAVILKWPIRFKE